jgi:hypothetical protein
LFILRISFINQGNYHSQGGIMRKAIVLLSATLLTLAAAVPTFAYDRTVIVELFTNVA